MMLWFGPIPVVLFFLHGLDCLIVDSLRKLVFQRCFVYSFCRSEHGGMATSCFLCDVVPRTSAVVQTALNPAPNYMRSCAVDLRIVGLRRLFNDLAQLSLSSFLKRHRGVGFGAYDSLGAELCKPQWIM
jgi:hypothetical protein